MDAYIRRTYEPFKFLGRLMLVPLKVSKGTPVVTLTQTWEAEEPHRIAPTVVLRLGPVGLGIGWWLDSDVENLVDEEGVRREIEEAQAAYDAYVAVNGEIDRSEFDAIRKEIGTQGLDLDHEMALMQAHRVFE